MDDPWIWVFDLGVGVSDAIILEALCEREVHWQEGDAKFGSRIIPGARGIYVHVDDLRRATDAILCRSGAGIDKEVAITYADAVLAAKEYVRRQQCIDDKIREIKEERKT